MKPILFFVNGREVSAPCGDTTLLIDHLRDTLQLKGTRFGCGEEQCGACVVLADGKALYACQTEIGHLQGRHIETVESLACAADGRALLNAFEDKQAAQCGFCTSGILMRASRLLRVNPAPSRAQIVAELEPHLCRCGAHNRMIDAISCAAQAGVAE